MSPNEIQVHMRNIVNAINTFMKTHEKQLNTLDIDFDKIIYFFKGFPPGQVYS